NTMIKQELLQSPTEVACHISNGMAIMENEYLHVEVGNDGVLSMMDKVTGKVFKDLLVLEDTGDIGNEYMYFAAENDRSILSHNNKVALEVVSQGVIAKLRIVHELDLPEER